MYYDFMLPILSMQSSASLDHDLISRYLLSESALIDGAALKAFEKTRNLIHGKVLVMVGPGNNGSDGLSLARILKEEGFSPDIFYLYEKGNDENLRRRGELEGFNVVYSTEGYDTVYDALFGFSFHGNPDERTEKACRDIASADTVISLDVPSANLVEADATVVFMVLKDVLYTPSSRAKAGKIMLANPGFPESGLLVSPDDIYLLEDSDSTIHGIGLSDYKNTRGHLFIAGGSERYTGAPRLTGRSAFFAGAGLVTVITSSDRIREDNPSFIISSSDDFSAASSVAVGPGWDKGDRNLFDKAVASGKPLVIDADGLRFVPGHHFSSKAVLTPHIGEYRALMKALSIPDGLESSRTLSTSLRKLAVLTGSVVVLKSSVVWITDGGRIYIYDGCNPSLGVAGSGDVLTGIIGALLAGGEKPLEAAINGVILHQRAGRKAHEDYGFYSAEELILEVGKCR